MRIDDEVRDALAEGRPVVALESTLVAHGLPHPVNIETATAACDAVRAAGAVPATVAVWDGELCVGLSAQRLADLAAAGPRVAKLSSRDLAGALAAGSRGATTVAATLVAAARARIRVFATGGIGGVHPDAELSFDVSADLFELARRPVAVVCSGAKSVLDVARTLELLETLAVPVIGYGCDELPAFYARSSGHPVPLRLDAPAAVAALLRRHWHELGQPGGVVLAQPVPTAVELPRARVEALSARAAERADARGLRGAAVTPFLLHELAELSGGATLRANTALVIANAELAARVASQLAADVSSTDG